MVGSCVLQCQMRSWRRTSRNLTRIKNCYHYTPIWWLPPNHQFSCDTFFLWLKGMTSTGRCWVEQTLSIDFCLIRRQDINNDELSWSNYSMQRTLTLIDWYSDVSAKKISSRNQICQHSNHGQIWLVTNIVCLWYFIAQTNNGAFVQLCKYFELTKRLNFLSIFPTLGITFTIGCWLHGSIKESNITLKFILTN